MATTCEVMEVERTATTDQVVVYWRDFEPGKGELTITCWGSAWTSYFGGMAGESIQTFFQRADTSYLANKLGSSEVLKKGRKEERYLTRVIEVIKGHLREAAEKAGAR